jgi:hypothetical protein
VAALVYAGSDDPDALLGSFATNLVACGYDPVGLQRRRGGRRGYLPMLGTNAVAALSAATPSLLAAVRSRPDPSAASAIRLNCTRHGLARWWVSLSRPPLSLARSPTVFEQLK